MHTQWLPGDDIVLRETWRGQIWTVRPMKIVQDTADLIAMHMVPGTVCKHPCSTTGKPVSEFLPDKWQLTDRVWSGGDMLCLHLPGTWHTVKLFWSERQERKFQRWYVNLQEPLRRSRVGFDYLDQELDVVIDADRTFYWKDEEAFQAAMAHGTISRDREKLLRAEGERVIRQMQSGDWFADGWSTWVPPEIAKTPALLNGWDEL